VNSHRQVGLRQPRDRALEREAVEVEALGPLVDDLDVKPPHRDAGDAQRVGVVDRRLRLAAPDGPRTPFDVEAGDRARLVLAVRRDEVHELVLVSRVDVERWWRRARRVQVLLDQAWIAAERGSPVDAEDGERAGRRGRLTTLRVRDVITVLARRVRVTGRFDRLRDRGTEKYREEDCGSQTHADTPEGNCR